MSTSPTDSYLGFIGVSTGGSSIRAVFPEWAAALHLPTRTLVGHDVPLDSPADVYRDLVRSIRDDPRHRGALITTHKTAVYESAADLFDELDDSADRFGEISSISKRDDRLIGRAMDPLTVRLALQEFVADDHFAAGADAVVLGCGGAGIALSHELGSRRDRPRRIICTDVSQAALSHARSVHEGLGSVADVFSYLITDTPQTADEIIDRLPPGSLVVNATGMGKDRPGSPVSAGVRFPERGLVWEFNYRGPRDFLQYARQQQESRALQLEDGWRYFVHGWSQVIADVFDIPMPPGTVDQLARIAEEMRS